MRRKYRQLGGELHIVELNRDSSSGSLGLDLMAHGASLYVSAIDEGSLVATDGRIRIGDELLEVNGETIHKRPLHSATRALAAVTSARVKFVLIR